MKNKKKIKQFQLLLTAVFTLVAIILVFFDDADDVWLIVRRINMVYLGAIIVLSFLYHGLVALTLTKLTKSVVPEYTYRKGFINAMIAAFFHGVTPGASGGQVAQLYVFNKQGVSSSEATSILLIEFLVYQTAMIFVSLGLLLVKFQYYLLKQSMWFIFVLFGFVLNAGILVGLYFLANDQRFFNWVSIRGVTLLAKLRIVKDTSKAQSFLGNYALKFKQQQSKLIKQWPLMIELLFVNIARVGLFYITPYFVLLALGVRLPTFSILDIMALTSFVALLQIFIFLPGGFGGTEALFVFLFSSFTSLVSATSTMLIWRFATFYLIIIVGGLLFVGFKIAYRR